MVTDRARGWRWNPERKLAAELRAEGHTWASIAETTGYSEGGARNLMLVPEFADRVAELSAAPIEEAQLILKAHAREAAETVVQIMRNGKAKRDEPKLAAAQDILDRMGVQSRPDVAPAVDAPVNITVTNAVFLAERAYIAALRGESAPLVAAIHAGGASVEGADGVSALRLPSGVSRGPESGSDHPQGATGGHEPGGGA